MPWTLSHPAAVLPFRFFAKRPLRFAALVIGSTTPDVGYSLNRFDLAIFAHTMVGSFVACVPTGLILLIIFGLFRRPVTYTLPSPHRQALMPLCLPLPRKFTDWAVLLLALWVGAWTHIFWDAFTHEGGWFVEHWPALQQSLGDWLFTNVHVYLLLQEISTVVGLTIIVLAYWLWLRQRPVTESSPLESEAWRYLFWSTVIIVSFAICVPEAVGYAIHENRHGLSFARTICFQTAITFTALAPLLIIIGSGLIYVRRPR